MTGARLGTVPTKGTTRRSVRINDELWDKAKAKADERGDELSAVIRAALEQYVNDQFAPSS